MNNGFGKKIVRKGQNKHLLEKCMRLKHLLGLKRKKKIAGKITQMRQSVIGAKQFQLCPRFQKQSQYWPQ